MDIFEMMKLAYKLQPTGRLPRSKSDEIVDSYLFAKRVQEVGF